MWLFNNVEVSQEVIPEKAIGFIYMISNIETNKRYIGRKLLTKAATKTVKGVKKKFRKESDWKDYWSSSPYLLECIDEEGKDKFKREILFFCEKKSELNYSEEKLLYSLGVLESDGWYNSNIRSKMYRSWIKNFSSLDLTNKTISDINSAIAHEASQKAKKQNTKV